VVITKPGSVTIPYPGIRPELVDGKGIRLASGGGFLTIAQPWPGMLRTIFNDDERYRQVYWSRFPGRYFTGDGAKLDDEGYWWILGRVDDVLNVAGHRIGTMEVESALVAHPRVAEAAVVGRPHEIKGEAIAAFVICKGARPTGADADALVKELRELVAKTLGPVAKPDDIRFADNLPKTRSGKIMRRLLRSIARNEAITQDVSTLENPAIVAQLQGKA
jgi:acetyl-CoA synthetase